MNKDTNKTRIRPRTVTVAATLQLLVAAAFLIAPALGFIFGADAQAAAEAEVVRQGLPSGVLADTNVRFDEGGTATVIPVAVALGVAVLGWLNLAGKRAGRILSLIFQPLVIALDGFILVSQASVVQVLESTFKTSGDAALQNVNVQAILDAVAHAYPTWVPLVSNTRIILTPLASLIVIVLLVVPSASAYFRKGQATS